MRKIVDFIKAKKIWLIVVVIVLGGGFIFYHSQSKNALNTSKKTTVKRDTLKEVLSLSGEIDAQDKVTLRFQTSGKLSWVGVKEGDMVKKYQMLATLDQREVKNQLTQYLNLYSKERRDFEQTAADNKDWQTNGMTDQAREGVKRVIEKSQYDLENSVLNVELKDLALEYSRLWTPIEGLVTKVNAPNAGVNVTPTSAEFEVVNPNTIYFVATADQNEVTRIKEGMRGEIVLDSYPDEVITGEITHVAFTPRSGESSIVYEIKIEFSSDNSSYKYRLGMTGDVSFVLSQKDDVLVLPSKYIKSENGKKYVWVLREDNKEKKYIEVGDTFEGDTEIISGLEEGITVYD